MVTHGRHRKFGGNGGELRGVQVFSMHLYTNKIACTPETTSKREKASKLEGDTKVSKTKRMENKIKIAKKREKEITGQNKKHSKKPKVLQASEQQRSGQRRQKPGQQGIYRKRKNLQ